MAVRGNGYTKTAWSYRERPVASAKLNAWDDRIEAAFELAFHLISLAWGGGDGVIRNSANSGLQVKAANPATLNVRVAPGFAFIANMPFRLDAECRTADIAVPLAHPRIDLVQARLEDWGIVVKTGSEAASPQSPQPDDDCILLARIHARPGMTAVRDTDDGINGWINDARAFV